MNFEKKSVAGKEGVQMVAYAKLSNGLEFITAKHDFEAQDITREFKEEALRLYTVERIKILIQEYIEAGIEPRYKIIDGVAYHVCPCGLKTKIYESY